MTHPTKVLIVEDNPADAELLEIRLVRAGVPVVSQRVETEEEYVQALDEFHPDIVIADNRLPRFDGITALKLAKARYPALPFVVVTGGLQEGTEETLRAHGVSAIVFKHEPEKLVVAVRRILEQPEIPR
jgi:two-component system sensor kinase